MTVQELIDQLTLLNPKAEVLIDDNRNSVLFGDIQHVLTLVDHADTFIADYDHIERTEYAMDYVDAHRGVEREIDPVILSYWS